MTDFTQRLQNLSDKKRHQLARRIQALRNKNVHRQLVAFVVPHDEFNEPSFREHLSTFLPDYMLPGQYVELDKLPRTSNGKISRTALAFPERTTLPTELNTLEKKLVDIWCDVLDMELIHADDNYFELGGDSITSIQIISRAAKIDLAFSLTDLMENPSIRQLVLKILHDKDLRLEPSAEPLADESIQDKDEMLRILDLD